jgi:hypothetical protein
MQLIRPNHPTSPPPERRITPVPRTVLDSIRERINSQSENTLIADMSARQANDFVVLANQPVGGEDLMPTR